jgi:hypothetical protein
MKVPGTFRGNAGIWLGLLLEFIAFPCLDVGSLCWGVSPFWGGDQYIQPTSSQLKADSALKCPS